MAGSHSLASQSWVPNCKLS